MTSRRSSRSQHTRRIEAISLTATLLGLLVGIVAIPHDFWSGARTMVLESAGFFASRVLPRAQINIQQLDQSGREIRELHMIVRLTTETEGQAHQICAKGKSCFYIVKILRGARLSGLRVDDIVVAVDERARCGYGPEQGDLRFGSLSARESLKRLIEVARHYRDGVCATIIRSDKSVQQVVAGHE